MIIDSLDFNRLAKVVGEHTDMLIRSTASFIHTARLYADSQPITVM